MGIIIYEKRRGSEHREQEPDGTRDEARCLQDAIFIGFDCKPAAYKKEQRHMNLGDELEDRRTVNLTHAHGQYMTHHHQKDGETLHHVEIFQPGLHIILQDGILSVRATACFSS